MGKIGYKWEKLVETGKKRLHVGQRVWAVGVGMFIWLRHRFLFGLASWCVAVGSRKGAEETPPTSRIAPPRGKPRGLATEQKRHVPPDLAMKRSRRGVRRHGTVKRLSCKWKGQTVADEESTGRRG